MSRATPMRYMRGRGHQLRADNRLKHLASQIENEHRTAHRLAGEALEHAAECGRLLTEAKDGLAHGQFLPWLEANTTVGARQAQKYMRLARHWPEVEANANSGSHLSIDGALRLLSSPSESDTRLADIAKEINEQWAAAEEQRREWVRCVGEARETFKDDGGDEAFKPWLMQSAGISKAFAERIPALLDGGSDEDWSEAMLADIEASLAAGGAS